MIPGPVATSSAETRGDLCGCIQTVGSPHRYYRVAAHRFLAYLQTDFPQVLSLSELRRDPHLLGWLRCLCEQDPPLSNYTRRIYLIGLRRLLRDFASAGHPALILPRISRRGRRATWKASPLQKPRPPLLHPIFGEIFDAQIQALTATRQPSTIASYRGVARDFLLSPNPFPAGAPTLRAATRSPLARLAPLPR